MPKQILLADDSITIQKVIALTFAGEDYNITSVDNGADAIAKAREIRPNIVLADVMMPQKNGYEVCEAIKSDPALKGTPVLLLAGTFEPFDEDQAKKAGADGHIIKPFESQSLIRKVKELVDARAAMPVAPPIPPAAPKVAPAVAPPVPVPPRPAAPPVSAPPRPPAPPAAAPIAAPKVAPAVAPAAPVPPRPAAPPVSAPPRPPVPPAAAPIAAPKVAPAVTPAAPVPPRPAVTQPLVAPEGRPVTAAPPKPPAPPVAAPVIPPTPPAEEDFWGTFVEEAEEEKAPAEAFSPEMHEEAVSEEEVWDIGEFEEPAPSEKGASAAEKQEEDLWGTFAFEDTGEEVAEEVMEAPLVEEVAPAEEEFAFVAEETLLGGGVSPVQESVEEEFAFGVEEVAEPVAEGVSEVILEEVPVVTEVPVEILPEEPMQAESDEFAFLEEETEVPSAPEVYEQTFEPEAVSRELSFTPSAEPVTAPPSVPAAISEEQLRAVLSQASREVIEKIVWEVVPDLAEMLIKEEIKRLQKKQ